MQRTFITAGLLGLAFVSSTAFAEDAKIPQTAQGVWAEGGNCHGPTVTITADTLRYKGGKPEAVYFAPKESPRGYGAIHYVQQGNVDNFEYADDKDQMIYNPEGFGMGKSVLYKRCR